MAWVVELLDDRVRDELESLPLDMKARFRRIVQLIQDHGLDQVREPHIKHLEGPLREMRLKGGDGISRAIYVTPTVSRRSGLHQENSENTKGRIYSGPA